jgi:hypothetical protein
LFVGRALIVSAPYESPKAVRCPGRPSRGKRNFFFLFTAFRDVTFVSMNAILTHGRTWRRTYSMRGAMTSGLRSGLVLIALCFAIGSEAAQPIIDNERVAVWDVSWLKDDPNPIPQLDLDVVAIYLQAPADSAHKKGDVVLFPRGNPKLGPGERLIAIVLKNHPVAPIANTSGFPLAFPRPHVKKVLENDRVIVWSYAWNPGEATPMHFHDKDVVVVYLEDTSLRSTTPDGKGVDNNYLAFDTRFNKRDRVHTETLNNASGSAIITELK